MKQQGVIFRSYSTAPRWSRRTLRFVDQHRESRNLRIGSGLALLIAILAILPFFQPMLPAQRVKPAAISQASPTTVFAGPVDLPTPTPIPENGSQPAPTTAPTKAPVKPIIHLIPVAYADERASVSYILPLPHVLAITTYFSSYHPGVDLAVEYGTPIFAAESGVVIEDGWSTVGYGNTIVIEHKDGSTTRYAHLSVRSVNLGDSVTRGQVIGNVGCTGNCTGPHLHFEVHKNGQAINPLSVLPPF